MGPPHGLLHGSHMNKCKPYEFVTGNKREMDRYEKAAQNSLGFFDLVTSHWWRVPGCRSQAASFSEKPPFPDPGSPPASAGNVVSSTPGYEGTSCMAHSRSCGSRFLHKKSRLVHHQDSPTARQRPSCSDRHQMGLPHFAAIVP